MADGPIRMSVKSATLLNDDDLNKYNSMVDQELAKVAPLPQPTPAAPAAETKPAPPPAPEPVHPQAVSVPQKSEAEALGGYLDQLKAAQAQAAKNVQMARFGQAGQSLIDSVSGHKNGAFYDGLAKDAEQPVQDVNAQFGMQKDVLTAKKKAEDGDPASPENRAAQQAFAATYPDLAKSMGPALSMQTNASLKNWTGAGEKKDTLKYQQDTLAALGGWRKTQDENTDLERARKIHQDEVNNVFGKFKATAGLINAVKLPNSSDQQQNKANDLDERYDINRLKALGTDTSKFSELAQALKTLDQVAPGMTRGKVPEDYPLNAIERLKLKDPTGLAGNFVDPRAQKVHQALAELTDLVSRARSGAVLNDSEIKRYKELLANGIAAGPQQTATAVNALRQAIGHKLLAVQLSTTKKAPNSSDTPFNMWQSRGGLTYHDLLDENEYAPSAGAGAVPGGDAGPGPGPSAAPSAHSAPSAADLHPMPVKAETKPPRKAYSPSMKKTYTLDSTGNVVLVEDGDTRG